MFGELVASGWHTAAITMRLLVDNYVNDAGAMGARGLEELRWLEPVRPGDTLSVHVEITGKSPLDERRGEVTPLVETTTADGDVVQRMQVSVLYPRRRE
jgi:acyl dehydratase